MPYSCNLCVLRHGVCMRFFLSWVKKWEYTLTFLGMCLQSKPSIFLWGFQVAREKDKPRSQGKGNKVHSQEVKWQLLLIATVMIIFKIQHKMDPCCFLKCIKDQNSSFHRRHGERSTNSEWRKVKISFLKLSIRNQCGLIFHGCCSPAAALF